MIFPSHAISSLSACSSQPSCAAAFATQSSVRSALVNGTTTATSKIVPFTRVAAGGAATTGSLNYSTVGKVIFALTGSSLIAKYFTEDDTNNLKNQAAQNYCASNTCGQRILLGSINFSYQGNLYFGNVESLSVIQGEPLVFEVSYTASNSPVLSENLVLPNGYNEEDYSSFEAENTGRQGSIYGYPLVDYDGLTEQQKQDAIDTITDQDIIENSTSETVDLDLLPGDVVTFDDLHVDGDTITDGEFEISKDLLEENETQEQEEEEENPDPKNVEELQLEELEPEPYSTSINFVEHAKLKFKDKFPFDVFGSSNGGGSTTACPSYSFFDRNFELCPISEVFGILKYPVVIGYLIWSLQSI